MTHPARCTATEQCAMRKKIVLTPFNLPQEHCGVSDAEVADFLIFEQLSPLGRPMLTFRYCPWCGVEWKQSGKVHEMPKPAPDEGSDGESWKKGAQP